MRAVERGKGYANGDARCESSTVTSVRGRGARSRRTHRLSEQVYSECRWHATRGPGCVLTIPVRRHPSCIRHEEFCDDYAESIRFAVIFASWNVHSPLSGPPTERLSFATNRYVCTYTPSVTPLPRLLIVPAARYVNLGLATMMDRQAQQPSLGSQDPTDIQPLASTSGSAVPPHVCAHLPRRRRPGDARFVAQYVPTAYLNH